MKNLLDLVLHLDTHLAGLTQHFGGWTYLLIFVILFAETGFVVTPFLPGDSLLFLAGAIAASQTASLSILVLFFVCVAAAIAGDSANYEFGKRFGRRLFERGKNGGAIARLLNKENLARTEAFFHKHGSKAVIIARFVPVIRTFAPFVAGTAHMPYPVFLRYNAIGGLLWVGLLLFGGYFFGNLPAVRDHFFLVTVTLIVLSLVPVAWEIIQHRRSTQKQSPSREAAGTQ